MQGEKGQNGLGSSPDFVIPFLGGEWFSACRKYTMTGNTLWHLREMISLSLKILKL